MRLKQEITELGLTLVTPMDVAMSHGVVILQAPPGGGGEISQRLYAEHGIAGSAAGGVRLSPTIYNTQEHIDRAIQAIRSLMT